MIFSFVNTFAFQFLAGNVVLLFLIRLGANNALVGLVASFFNLSYFIMPVGRLLSRKIGIVRGFVSAWFVRYLVAIPLIVAPLVAQAMPESGGKVVALWMVVAGYLFFQLVRGAGLVGFSPMLTEVSHGRDRGRYLSLSRILTDSAILLGSLCVALFISEEAPYIRYFISFALGTGLGFVGVFSLSRIPEITRPEGHVDHGLIQSFRDIYRNEIFRRYFITLVFVGFILGVLRPFILVYVKDVYGFSDSRVLLLTVVGSVGAIVMGLMNRAFLDRVGAKPLLIIWIALMLLPSLAVAVTGNLNGWILWTFLILFFFAINMGISGADNTSQTYFFGMISSEQQMSYGIIYFLSTGISGALGANAAGVTLDLLQGPGGMTALLSQRILFSAVTLLLVLALIAAARMKRLGALSLRRSLSEIFRIRQRTRNQG